ncbi:acyltransferase ChoActase/COT/CPT [Polychytrium aggregatum]|uniref:acyltransferase ChoActase/COT/CPT n=1 Tax=Polychytrium aggregatum TaxID=110093 RepID=UPI0022FF370E|nr:acyltransferase ChoActase/COT/CPT [Polychytrium aggregatum]KAI9199855.1 acyltransferase ChoActase/COT/CPT [Polychytrium aggregatum]
MVLGSARSALTRSSSTLPPLPLVPSDASKPLYKFQQSLPTLPVPKLEETAAKYLRSVRPHLDDAAFAKTEAAVKEFLKPGSIGHVLQQRLLEKAQNSKTSWLYDWWNDLSYMAYRDPVVFFVSYFYLFKDDPRVEWKSNVQRGAAIIQAAMQFRHLVVSEELQADLTKNSALSADQYQWMFNNCRIPVIPSDTTAVYDPHANNHVLIIRKNQFFTFEAIHKDGTPLTTSEIAKQLSEIVKAAGEKKGVPVGAFTGEDRDVWTKTREEFLATSPKNKAFLTAIESSAFVLCLDDSAPVTRIEASRGLWHGDGQNRFYDKPLEFTVFENGKAGFLGEHSMMDGTPTHRMCEWILDSLAKNSINHGSKAIRPDLVPPKKLEFVLTPSLERQLEQAVSKFDKTVQDHNLQVLAYRGFGKDFIKTVKFSPDAFVQMAIQLAYYKMHKVSRPTYESAQTRKFQFGRTETCRSVSLESSAFVKAFTNEGVAAGQVDNTVKAKLLKAAVDSHVSYMADAVDGRGCDRHLFGLKLSLKDGETVPAIFADPAYNLTRHWNISTSQISSEYYDGWGWGEVVPDGYGIAYMIKEKTLHFNVVSLNGLRPDRLAHYIGEALDEMRQVLTAVAPKPSNEPVKAKL